MKAALAIAAAEIRQSKLVFWGALAFGAFPLFLHFVRTGVALGPAAPGQEMPYPFLIAITAVGYSLAIAVLMGGTVVARDIGERRLGFWLSRPVPLLAYWGGKLGAAFFLAVIGGLLTIVPAHLLWALRWSDTLAGLSRTMQPWLVAIALAVGGAAAAGGAFRSRSGVLLLDIVLLPLTLAATFLAFGSSVAAGADDIVAGLIRPTLLVVAALVLLAASAAQVSVGRFDFRRGHLALSAVAWGGLLIFFAGTIFVVSRYVAAATVTDLRLSSAFFLPAPAGDRVLVEGRTVHRGNLFGLDKQSAGFLLDEAGNASSIGGNPLGLKRSAWSSDGTHVAWVHLGMIGSSSLPQPLRSVPGLGPSLHVHHLARGARPRMLRLSAPAAVLAVSPSGRRILLATAASKRVVDAETGEPVATLDAPASWTRAAFVSEDLVRALSKQLYEPTSVVEWNLAAGKLDLRWPAASATPLTLVPSGDWQQVLRFDASGLFLHDLDGRIVATLVDGWGGRANRAAGPLSGGRYGCIEEEAPGRLRLRVFGSDGRTLTEVLFEGRFPVRVGGEPRPGVLALAPTSLDERPRATQFVDIADGTLARPRPDSIPALRRWEPLRELEAVNPEPGSLATRLFLDRDGRLSSIDPAGGQRVIVTPRARNER